MPDTHTQMVDLPDFAAIVSADNVITDAAELNYFSQDYFTCGPHTQAVLRPRNTKELAETVALATKSGLAVYPRGGGYSYTDAYIVTKPGVTLDLQSMNRVLEINETDMYVTVEAGCTWADLDAELAKVGLRTPFWGPMSGLKATVGGSAAQGAISFGSGCYGVSAETIVGMKVIAADGRVIPVGSAGQPNHSAFFRHYGPDMTGPFTGDSGALGVKAEITLRLMRRPTHVEGLSFGFTTMEAMVAGAAAVAREGLVSESLGLPARLVIARSQSGGLLDDLKTLWTVGAASSSVLKGLSRVTRIALAGRGFMKDLEHTFHYAVEGSNQATVNGKVKAIRDAATKHGVEIANTVPTVLRSAPFPPHDMLGPGGRRQLPPSTILPFSQVLPFHKAFSARLEQKADAMAKFKMSAWPTLATVGTNGFLYEPVISWEDAPQEFHRRNTSEATLGQAADFKDDPAARDLALAVRQDMIDLAFEHGGIHLQIGKVYPFAKERDSGALGIIKALKADIDPNNMLNPGALGI